MHPELPLNFQHVHTVFDVLFDVAEQSEVILILLGLKAAAYKRVDEHCQVEASRNRDGMVSKRPGFFVFLSFHAAAELLHISVLLDGESVRIEAVSNNAELVFSSQAVEQWANDHQKSSVNTAKRC